MSTSTPFEVEQEAAAQTSPNAQQTKLTGDPRILVIRRRYLGDLVLLGSVLRNLRLHWPAARIVVLTEAAYAGVVGLNPDADGVLVFPRRWREWGGFLRELRQSRSTHVLDFDNTDKTALVARLTGAGVRATYNRELIPFRYPWAYTHTAQVSNQFYDSHHITETYLALPAAIGVPILSRAVALTPKPEYLEAARRFVAQGGNRVLIHPGSRSPHRVWPVERFAEICDQVQDTLGAQVFVTCGPGEQPLAEQIRARAQAHVVLVPPPGHVGRLAAFLAQFDVFVCHDSGPMHVAAAVGTPVVALFGSQNATIWRPLGTRHAVLQTPLPCACIGSAAPTPCVPGDSYRSYCVRKISTEDVFKAVTHTLALGRS